MASELAETKEAPVAPAVQRADMDIWRLGKACASSGFFPDAKSEAQAVVKILAGREMGFGAVTSMMGIHIVQGRVTLGGNLIAAAIKASGKYDYRIKEHDDKHCVIEFFEGGKLVGESAFSIADAQRAGLADKNNWKQYPRNMYFNRAIGNGARWYCPDILNGITPYTPEELGATVEVDATGAERVVETGDDGKPVEAPDDDRAKLNRAIHAEYAHELLHDHAVHLGKESFADLTLKEMQMIDVHLKDTGRTCGICKRHKEAQAGGSDVGPGGSDGRSVEPEPDRFDQTDDGLDALSFYELASQLSDGEHGTFDEAEAAWKTLKAGFGIKVDLENVTNYKSDIQQSKARPMLLAVIRYLREQKAAVKA